MSINRNEIIIVLDSLDAINRINELQDLLQVVVEQDKPNSLEACKRIQLMSELFLDQTTPLLQNLTVGLTVLQEYFKEKL